MHVCFVLLRCLLTEVHVWLHGEWISLNYFFHLLQKDRENKKLEELVASQKQELEQLSSKYVISMMEERKRGEREKRGEVTRGVCVISQDCRCTVSTPRVR